MPRPYDDNRYLVWVPAFQQLVAEFLDTDGNDEDSLREEFENAIQNAKEE